MSEIWLYPKQYNQMYKNSYIRIVERAYTEDVRVELDCYLDQIKKLTHIINCVGHEELIGNEEFLKGTGFYTKEI